MKNVIHIIGALSILIIASLACASQISNPDSSESVETIVAGTMQALTPGAPATTNAAPTLPSGTSGLLPHPLYYLSNDSAGFLQVHRLERDGKTVQQITFEPSHVDTYAVSPVDGSVAYSSNNQLLLVNSDGASRRILVDGGPLESDDSYYKSRVGGVAWSPDGKTISFGYGGLNFYALDSGAINKVLENQIDNDAGFPILREAYWPIYYSPDGSKLLTQIAYYEGGVYAIYYLGGNTLVKSEDNPVMCCDGSWAPDSSAFYAASPYLGMISPGLWRLNADGTVNDLITSDYSGTTFQFAQAPIVGPDGQLYFFYSSQPNAEGIADRVPLYMVRSALDGVTGRTILSPAPIESINEIIWAPDASFAIIAIAPVENIYLGGKAEIHYPDGSPRVPLVPFAQDMRWGP